MVQALNAKEVDEIAAIAHKLLPLYIDWSWECCNSTELVGGKAWGGLFYGNK